MGVLRFLFAPEFTRLARDTGAAGGRLARLAGAAVPARRAGPVAWSAAFERRHRLVMALAVSLATGGLGLIFAWFSADAAAQQSIDPGLFAGEDGETRQILSFLHDLTDPASATVLGDMLFLFNGGILVLAGVLLVWHVVAGTMDTARQGRFGFGGWQILRVVTAVALMAPLAGGLSGGQHIVLGLANLGGDFANAIWAPFTSDILSPTRAIASNRGERAIRTIIGRALLTEVCLFAANGAAVDLVRRQATAEDSAQRIVVRYAGTDPDIPQEICGAIVYDGLVAPSGISNLWPFGDSSIPPVDHELAQIAAGRVPAAHYHALNTAIAPDLQAMAAELAARFLPVQQGTYGDPLPEADSWLAARGLDRRYADIVGRALEASALERDQAMRELAQTYADDTSWLYAAGFFNVLAWQTGRFAAAAVETPEVRLPVDSLATFSPHADTAVRSILAWLSRSTYSPIPTLGSTAAAPGTAATDPDALISGLFDYVPIDWTVLASGGNPIVDLATLGHWLVHGALAAIGALAGIAIGSNLVESIPLIGGGLDAFEAGWSVLDGFITVILSGMLIAGAVLAYLLPAVPFIRFLFGILTWILSVIEAVLAITIFAAAHVTREDPDSLVTSSTRMGWLFLPGLVLRPVLMIFGLVLGYFAFLAVMTLLNAAWVPLMQISQASGSTSQVGFLAMLVLYTVVAWTAINSAFKLIDILPRQVLAWIGGAAGMDAGGSEETGATVIGAAGRFGALAARRR
ncbi:MAG: DotA/TraY family protein [bacterium]|nr:DotA/TraY family protein [bacterium]